MPLVILLLILLPTIAFGADPVKYKPLIEGIGLGGEGSFDAFINQLYIFSITLAALLAVIKIIVAGVKYSLSEIVNTKGEAKGEIKGALFGLLIVMSAVLILEVINPQLVNINFNPEPVEPAAYSQPVSASSRDIPDDFVKVPLKDNTTCANASGIWRESEKNCYIFPKGENRGEVVQPGDPRWKPTDIDPVVKQALTDAEKEAARVAAEKAKADADGEADTAN